MSKGYYGLSSNLWNELDDKTKSLYHLVRPMQSSNYAVSIELHHLERQLERYDSEAKKDGGELKLNPDFQRGHVWSLEKQISYIENLIRGVAPINIKFNCAKFIDYHAKVTGMNGFDMVCVDGLQRMTAVLSFMKGDFKIFDNAHDVNSLAGTPFAIRRYSFLFEIYDIRDYGDLIQFYIDLNTGGVVHSNEEIDRVKKLQEEYRNK